MSVNDNGKFIKIRVEHVLVDTPSTGGGNGSSSEVGAKASPALEKENSVEKQTKLSKIATTGALVTVVKGTINYGVSNVGKWTGSSMAQEQANNLMSGIGVGLSIIANPAVGIANLALNMAFKAFNMAWEIKQSNMQSSQHAVRIGYNVENSR